MPKSIPNDGEETAVASEAAVNPASGLIGGHALVISPLVGIALSVVAALVIWGVLESILPVFELSERLRELSGNAPEEQQRERMEASIAAASNNATLSMAMLAATIALFLAAAEAKFRRAGLRMMWGGVLAAGVAAGFAVGAGILRGELDASSAMPEDPLTETIVLQTIAWGITGLGIGLGVALGVSLPNVSSKLLGTCLFGGLLGGALGGLIYPLASSVLLPNARTEVSMPDPGLSLFLWLGLGAVIIALTVTGMGREKKKAEA
ncbi:MAG: hypothetical protein R3C19_10475 [Planctomycetaceae bacterium]